MRHQLCVPHVPQIKNNINTAAAVVGTSLIFFNFFYFCLDFIHINHMGIAYHYITCSYKHNMNDRLDRGDKNDETSTDVDASFSCADCGQQFKSRQELKERESTQH